MSLPSTYLLTAPSNADDPFGSAMSSANMLKKLKKMNPSIWVEGQYPDGVWYPGRASGLTCIWFGKHYDKSISKKISAFVPGMIPEFTQLDPKGFIMTLGWRRILEKVIASGACRRADVERSFGVTLDVVKTGDDGYCPSCMKKGKKVKATSSKNRCDFHYQLDANVEKARQANSDLKWLRKRMSCQQLLLSPNGSPMDSRTIASSA